MSKSKTHPRRPKARWRLRPLVLCGVIFSSGQGWASPLASGLPAHLDLLGDPVTLPIPAASLQVLALLDGTDRVNSENLPVEPPPVLRFARQLGQPTRDDRLQTPAFLIGHRVEMESDERFRARGDVELRQLGLLIQADELEYWGDMDQLEASGNVRLQRGEDLVAGPHLRLQLEAELGSMESARYLLRRPPKGNEVREAVTAAGTAKTISFEGENHYQLNDARYTSCEADSPDWYARVKDLKLDFDREEGVGKDATLVFKDVPFMYFPWFDFSLNGKRKSGFLAPTMGSNSRTGLEVSAPFYWNIAPNRDATLTPRFMTKRGLQLNSEFRYLEPTYNGYARLEYMPEDTILRHSRRGYSWLHNFTGRDGFTGLVNINGVSDPTYFTDLSSRITSTSQTQLLRQGSLTYNGPWYQITGNVQRYQTLQDPKAAPVARPYDRLPQFLLNAYRPDLSAFTVQAQGEFVDFSHPTLVRGRRLTFYPQVSLPLQDSAFYLTPKIGVHNTRYTLAGQADGVEGAMSRSVPIFSLDAGVTMEREVDWFGRSWTQTLEPRLYYLRVPAREQSRIPVFDTALADFNFAQIFAENLYVGGDRIADANQLTAAVTSRLINPATGAERIRAALGQRYYFADQTVTLPDQAPRSGRRADILAAVSGQVLPRTFLDSGWQYNPRDSRTERFNFGMRYQPDRTRVLNLGYRYTRDALREIDASAQWPLFARWYGVGRYNYSLKEKRLIQGIAGLEYDGGCWVVRMVAQRFAVAAQTPNTSFFVQLELNGLARVGSNPLDILKRGIAGYGKINQSVASPVFGDD